MSVSDILNTILDIIPIFIIVIFIFWIILNLIVKERKMSISNWLSQIHDSSKPYLPQPPGEAQCVFRGTIDTIRAIFLKETFGLLYRDLEMFHFDGKYFHFQDVLKHFSEFSSIRCLNSERVTITNSNLPHSKRWRHQTITGSPDLRYRNNPSSMESSKHRFRLEGQTTEDLVVYSESLSWFIPGLQHEFESLLEKMNRFLSLASKHDLETIIKEYESKTNKLRYLERLYASSTKSKAEVDVALAASLRLAVPTVSSVDAVRIQTEIKEKQTQLNSDIGQLQMQISIVKSELSRITQKVKDLYALQKYDNKTIIDDSSSRNPRVQNRDLYKRPSLQSLAKTSELPDCLKGVTTGGCEQEPYPDLSGEDQGESRGKDKK